MSETWKATSEGVQRFRAAWRDADLDTKNEFFWWVVGILMMAGAIIGEFGWLGLQFIVGFVFWKAMFNDKSRAGVR